MESVGFRLDGFENRALCAGSWYNGVLWGYSLSCLSRSVRSTVLSRADLRFTSEACSITVTVDNFLASSCNQWESQPVLLVSVHSYFENVS